MSARRSNARTVVTLAGVAFGMLGLSFAAVPLYDLFCRVTGYGGAVSQVDAASETVLDKDITIRFAASTDRGMAWDFAPVDQTVTLKIGETGLAFYRATNPTDHTITGSASFNVTPFSAGGYFSKIQCFCFTEQTLAPGESVEMPVTFFVDPEIVNDPEGKLVHTITLSYTFHEIEPEAEEAASLLDPDIGRDAVN